MGIVVGRRTEGGASRACVDIMLNFALQLADKLPEGYKGQRKAKATKAVGSLAFPYSLYFVFYEQYAFIQVLA